LVPCDDGIHVRKRRYGDLTSHLQHAVDVLPDDARMLFDRGCYAELLGLPMHQALLSEGDVVDQRAGGRHSDAAPAWATPSSTLSLRIPSAEKTNAEAERLFRRALAIDPSLVEARARLARLLDLRNRHKEAADELKTARAGNPRGVVAFYAHLFAGRVAQTMGQADDASRHYRDALTLFPDAQSALLAASQLALLGADVVATLAPVDRLGAGSAVYTADPWWQYHLCAGRDADDLLKELWASVPRSSREAAVTAAPRERSTRSR
jgi:tetratricopeptide (TPR) repeat protein